MLNNKYIYCFINFISSCPNRFKNDLSTKIGVFQVGAIGDSSLLDRAIQRVNEDPKKVHHSVSLQLRELGVRMICNETGNVILDHSYPEVSELYALNSLIAWTVWYFRTMFAISDRFRYLLVAASRRTTTSWPSSRATTCARSPQTSSATSSTVQIRPNPETSSSGWQQASTGRKTQSD
jgi:hypothetical protein